MDSNFHKDMLVDILLRLPPSARRRARLVCRLWRDLVDKRTTEMQSRAKALIWNDRSALAYVVDDLSPSSTGRCRELWRNPHPRLRVARYEDVDADDDLQLVGTCNGLLCLCDNNGGWSGGTVTLVNPATGATLPVPPLPRADVARYRRVKSWDKAYGFGYHPTTGRYKVVHAPTFPWRVCWGTEQAIYAVHVLTLEEGASWREVAPSCDARTRCRLDAGVVSVDGATYWVTGGGAPRVVSFDLDDERVRSFAMPSMVGRLGLKDYSLTEVRGRLGVVVHVGSGTTIWVRAERKWSHQYTLTSKYIPRPHFAYGDYILKARGPSLYVHRRKAVPSSGGRLPCAVIEVGHRDQDQGMMITNMKGAASHYRAFAHVETAEPLGVYTNNAVPRKIYKGPHPPPYYKS